MLVVFADLTSILRPYSLPSVFGYFAPSLVLALDAGEAAGDATGDAAGEELVAGVVPVAPAGEGDTDGDGLLVAGEYELSAGFMSQPAENTIKNMVRAMSAVRLTKLMFGFLIDFPSFQ